MGSIFRNKNMDRVASPEKMDDYIHVTTPPLWMSLVIVLLLLCGVLVWAITGRVTVKNQNYGYCQDGILTLYIADQDRDYVAFDTTMMVDDMEAAVTFISTRPVSGALADTYLLKLNGMDEGGWYYEVSLDADGLEDGIYAVSYEGETIKPISFLMD